ncbi:MAG: T9SS type A sorting domain-containing protein, partial [Flavobacteriaceae bacterium]|nr:T9SS type A sorting domain-containing protein [Flavobacteriaceae bacterium]
EGTVVWTYRYTDCTGQGTDDWTYTYTIDYTQGVTAPMDESSTVECPAEAVDPGPPATVQDACGRDVIPVLVGSTSTPDPVTCEGTVVWTYRYTDCTGQGTDDWTYTYTIDITTPPNAGMDDGSNVQCLDDATEPTPPSGVTDVCDRPIVPTGPVVNTVFDGCRGTRTYTWTYTDCSGLSDDWVYTYTIEDTINPEIVNLPEPEPLCNDQFPPYLEAEWTDNCATGGPLQSGGPVITMLDTCTEQAVYTFYVEDDCGNSDTETVTVIREFDLIENCETAFARLSPNNPPSQCFLDDDDYNFNRWGWTNYIADEGTYTMDLWAGAAHCDTSRGELVGTVTVMYYDDEVDVEYQLTGNYVMSEAHINIGCDKYPTKRNGQPTVAPGQYNFNSGSLNYVQNYTLEDVDVTGPFWIIAHGVTCELTCECSGLPGAPNSDTSTEDPINCTPAPFGESTSTSVDQTRELDWNLDFTMYPVPFDNYLNVAYNLEYDSNILIEVFDIRGRLIQTAQSDYTQGRRAVTRLDLGGTANEVLFIKVTTDRSVGMKKVVANNYIKD